MFNKVELSTKDILDKEFSTGLRGYKQEEVDKFLDIIIKDYEAYEQQIEKLRQENLKLKKQLETSPVVKGPQTGTTNFDIIQRLSNLEKHVFGDKLYKD